MVEQELPKDRAATYRGDPISGNSGTHHCVIREVEPNMLHCESKREKEEVKHRGREADGEHDRSGNHLEHMQNRYRIHSDNEQPSLYQGNRKHGIWLNEA